MELCRIDTRTFDAYMQQQAKQMPFAMAVALTRTAQKAKDAIRGSMQVGFHAPTAFTLNATFVQPATKTNLVATVKLKDQGSGGAPPSVWLAPEVYGGDRQAKRSEFLMRSSGVLPSGMFWTPGAGAKLDRYGNMSRTQVVNILAALKSNTSKYTGKRAAKGAGAKGEIFVGKPAGGRLPLGIWQRTADGLKPLMIFVNQPHYKVRLPFQEIATTVYQANFQSDFAQAMAEAQATAR